MADQQPTHAPPFWLAIGAAAIITGITGIAFWLSYYHLHDVATRYGLGIDPSRAWAWPAVLDLFYLAGELLILRASYLRSVDPWAIALASLGAGGSIALNVAGVGPGQAVLVYVVAAVPPVAALLAFGALMQQVHRYLAVRVEAAPTVVVERVVAPPVPVAPPVRPAVEQAPPVEEQPTPVVEQPVEPEPLYADARSHAVRPLYDAGYRPGTVTMRNAIVAAGFPKPSDSVIRGTIRAEVEREEPRLRDLPPEATPLHRAG
ncbi:DUF2637 domain-containing protein [Streptomyces sp. RKAG337]|uniref:DUF2637 domain-containing protein n=1 Tax=Streptomyces sp. RKAG337 TaxID=2893404 RepID=UPI0020336425|nr:DUF2637 domain-containing protein [Streptomyces sp. RKAG337]MCM2427371.1 DUF2637 domain-containing protein [Streptomyces sp. RKAG337]